MNNVSLIGRLTRDVSVKDIKTKNGEMAMALFTLAVQRNKEEADFISCKAFGRTAEFLEDWTAKGDQIGVVGRIQTGSYENKTGDKVYSMDVIVERVYFADGKREEAKPDPEPVEKASAEKAETRTRHRGEYKR